MSAPPCALAGCSNAVAPTEPGRPARRFCSPEHRTAARQTRTASAGQAPPRPTRSSSPSSATATDTASSLRAQMRAHLRRRRQLMAVVGAASLLAAGIGWIGTAAELPGQAPNTPATLAVPAGDGDWATRAGVVLASIREQLDDLALAEVEWDSTIASRYTGTGTPLPVQALLARKAELERQRVAIEAQLANHDRLALTEDEIAETERRIALIEAVLQDGAAAGTPDAQATVRVLEQQHQLLVQQRDAGRAELRRISAGVAAALETPLPDPGASSAPVIAAVLRLADPPADAPRPVPGSSAGLAPVLAAARTDERREQAEITTSAPGDDPDDAIERRGSEGRPDRPGTVAGGVLDTVADVADALPLLGGGRDDQDRPDRQDGRTGDGQDREDGDGDREDGDREDGDGGDRAPGPVREVVDTVGGLLGDGPDTRTPDPDPDPDPDSEGSYSDPGSGSGGGDEDPADPGTDGAGTPDPAPPTPDRDRAGPRSGSSGGTVTSVVLRGSSRPDAGSDGAGDGGRAPEPVESVTVVDSVTSDDVTEPAGNVPDAPEAPEPSSAGSDDEAGAVSWEPVLSSSVDTRDVETDTSDTGSPATSAGSSGPDRSDDDDGNSDS